jgi:hypothetical protein
VKNHDFTPQNHIFSNFRGVGWGRRVHPLDPPLVETCYLHWDYAIGRDLLLTLGLCQWYILVTYTGTMPLVETCYLH